MIVKAPEQKFPPAPEGSHAAVCVDEIDLGLLPNPFDPGKERHMIRLLWQIAEEMDVETAKKFGLAQGSRYFVKQDYTASLDEKAKLRKHLQSWRGRKFNDLELGGFDLETIVGAPCLLSVAHNAGSKGGIFANVEAVMKLPTGMAVLKPEGYVRIKDRAQQQETEQTPKRAGTFEEEPPPSPYAGFGITDDDLPF